MKIPLSKTEVHDKKDFVAKVYVTKSQDRPFNALLVEVLKRHYKVRLKNSTRLYFVIKGNGTFTVDGKKEKADLYDCFVIKHGQVYEYEGKMKLIEVNVPATDESNEEKLE
ncbi:MAG TPA: hypothetical protein VJA40_03975 [archaeon]|nr:hypothetical protein [archaeon]